MVGFFFLNRDTLAHNRKCLLSNFSQIHGTGPNDIIDPRHYKADDESLLSAQASRKQQANSGELYCNFHFSHQQ